MDAADESAESLMAKLEEYQAIASLVQHVRACICASPRCPQMQEETDAFALHVLPALVDNCQKLTVLFENIDRMEVCPPPHVYQVPHV